MLVELLARRTIELVAKEEDPPLPPRPGRSAWRHPRKVRELVHERKRARIALAEPEAPEPITRTERGLQLDLRLEGKTWQSLRRAEEVIVSDPEIRGGEPVVKGTRVPAYVVADLIDQGADLREILEDYPSLSANKVRAALAFPRTHPRGGRPRKSPWQ